MTEETRETYLRLAKNHTEKEISEIMKVGRRTIRKYREQTGVKFKGGKYENHDVEYYEKKFDEQFSSRGIVREGEFVKIKARPIYEIRGTVKCLRCGTKWETNIRAKINQNTGCIKCDMGRHGNFYTKEEAEIKMNALYPDQWAILKYGHYSKKDSIIQCSLCGHTYTVKLADFICTTSKRCTKCQTGSFGEKIIATTLLYNNIPFEREKRIDIDGKRYRMDFFIEDKIGVEYSGLQHFEKECPMYSEKIIKGIEAKKKWCADNSYEFKEIIFQRKPSNIIKLLSEAIGKELSKPTPEFYAKANPSMNDVLNYMKTHSSRQTERELKISKTMQQKYVAMAGYDSISAWQADNMKI